MDETHSKIEKKVCGCKKDSSYDRQESGVSDAATCHHGGCHKHHDVTPKHNEFIKVEPEEHEVDDDAPRDDPSPTQHRSFVSPVDPPINEQNHEFYNRLLHLHCT
jgi:hypothetical protein